MVWGTQEKAKKYMDEYKFPFPLYLDPQFEFYRELGLRRSVKNTFDLNIMIHYAENIVASDVVITRAYPGDDVVLITGDYITDSSGKLVYVYNAQHAHDRPSTETILSSLDDVAV